MFVYCDKCNWSQDDFWSEKYNPIICLNHVVRELLTGTNLDDWTGSMDRETIRDYAIGRLENAIKEIENMKYRTFEEFKKQNPEHKCPNCGEELGID